MLVKCLFNDLARVDGFSKLDRLNKRIHIQGPNYDLTVGGVYKVEAVEFVSGYLQYYIHAVEGNAYPFPYPAEFFAVVEGGMPVGWSASFFVGEDGVFMRRLSFPEWSNDEAFYEKLIDGDENSCAVYLAYRSEK